MSMRLILSIVLLAASLGAAAETNEKAAERTGRAAELLTEIMGAPDHAIPQDLLRRAHCVALIPGVKKVGLLVGAKYGKGVIACRTGAEGGWSGPSTVRLEGGSIGFQIGGSSTDVVLLVMNEEGVEKLRSSKFTLGADAAVAGGPVGRSAQAQTDAQMHAKILSYSRSRGLFAGLSLEGATLRPDADDNETLYGRKVSHEEILSGVATAPAAANSLHAALAKYSAAAAPAVETPVAEPAPPPSNRPGLITITSKPTIAEVELNGYFNGMTPRSKQVSPGEYQVTVRKAGFADWVRTVTVTPGERVTVEAELIPDGVAAAGESGSGQGQSGKSSEVSQARVSGVP
jgi:SH3 domain-containing YSC84-like protein 1